jgi:hypothetical protein
MDRLKRRGFAVGVVALSLWFVSGCGGGGGGDDGGITPISPATKTVALREGMTWRYSGDFVYTRANGQTQGGNIIGYGVSSIVTYEGEAFLLLDFSLTDTNTDIAIPARQLVFQPPQRDVILHALDSRTLAHDVVILPGEWMEGLRLTDTVQTDAGTETYSLTVQGTERVTVATRTFDVWRCQINKQSADTATSGTYWYAPELANYVKATYTTNFTGGTSSGDSTVTNLYLTGGNLISN